MSCCVFGVVLCIGGGLANSGAVKEYVVLVSAEIGIWSSAFFLYSKYAGCLLWPV